MQCRPDMHILLLPAWLEPQSWQIHGATKAPSLYRAAPCLSNQQHLLVQLLRVLRAPGSHVEAVTQELECLLHRHRAPMTHSMPLTRLRGAQAS